MLTTVTKDARTERIANSAMTRRIGRNVLRVYSAHTLIKDAHIYTEEKLQG